MINYNPRHAYPSSEELLDSDETPVDNELQDLIPGMLKAMLAVIWKERQDWFFGVDMAIYYDPDLPAVVPDGFLSLGVERVFDENLRFSYPLWEEGVMPTMVLEVVSPTYRGEYKQKKDLYASLEVPYYIIYNPQRRKAAKLEVYEWTQAGYLLLASNQTEVPLTERVWLEKIGLAIGRERGIYMGIEREWLYWYLADGTRVLPPEEALDRVERQNAKLAAKLRELGIDPSEI